MKRYILEGERRYTLGISTAVSACGPCNALLFELCWTNSLTIRVSFHSTWQHIGRIEHMYRYVLPCFNSQCFKCFNSVFPVIGLCRVEQLLEEAYTKMDQVVRELRAGSSVSRPLPLVTDGDGEQPRDSPAPTPHSRNLSLSLSFASTHSLSRVGAQSTGALSGKSDRTIHAPTVSTALRQYNSGAAGRDVDSAGSTQLASDGFLDSPTPTSGKASFVRGHTPSDAAASPLSSSAEPGLRRRVYASCTDLRLLCDRCGSQVERPATTTLGSTAPIR